MMRHAQWDEVRDMLDDITDNLGGNVFDARCGKHWDVGQAVCAEAYGPDWSNNVTFIEWNNKGDDEPPEPHYFKCAKRLAAGYVPEWADAKGDSDG